MKLKNILIIVKDIEVSKKFYKDLFGLDVILHNEGKVILTEGLVLQDKRIWESFIERSVSESGHTMELYFEEKDIDGFMKKLEDSTYNIEYIHRDLTHKMGRRMVQIYDPDGHMIEVGEPIQSGGKL